MIAADERIDRLEREIEEWAMRIIARRQPIGSDLREFMAAVKISSDLERARRACARRCAASTG